MKVSVFIPIKASHSTGCRLGWLVVGTSHHPTACAGKGQNELPGTVCWLRNWAGHLASTSPFLLCGCHPWRRRRRFERRVLGCLGAIHIMSVSFTFPKTTGAAASIPLLLALYSGFPFSDEITLETRTRSGLSLGFSICSSSLMWQQCWLGSRDQLLVGKGMRLLTGIGVRWHGAGLRGGDRWLYLGRWEAMGSCTFGKWREMRR